MTAFPFRQITDHAGTHYTATADIVTVLTHLVADWQQHAAHRDSLELYAASIRLEQVVDTLTVEAIGMTTHDA